MWLKFDVGVIESEEENKGMIEGKYWYIVNIEMCLCQEDRAQGKTLFYDFNPMMSTVIKFNKYFYRWLLLLLHLDSHGWSMSFICCFGGFFICLYLLYSHIFSKTILALRLYIKRRSCICTVHLPCPLYLLMNIRD